MVVAGSEGGDGGSVFKAGRVPPRKGGGWWLTAAPECDGISAREERWRGDISCSADFSTTNISFWRRVGPNHLVGYC